MKLLTSILSALRPGKEFVLNDDDLSTVRWSDPDVVTPTLEEVEAEIARITQEEADKKAAAEAKLAALGLTPEDFKALLS
jgi:hypothetical protein